MIVWFQCTVSRYPAVLSMIGRLLHKHTHSKLADTSHSGKSEK